MRWVLNMDVDGQHFCKQEYLEEHDSIDFNSFVEKVWPNVREIYKAKEKATIEVIAF